MEYLEKTNIYKKAKRIVVSDLTWSEKYKMIFSEEISMKFDFDWYDPDCGYEDDVIAYMNAFEEHMQKQKIIEEQINCED